MLRAIARLIPEKLAVKLWKNLPMTEGMRRRLLWGANTHFIAGVAGIVVNDKNELLLVKHTYKKPAWGLPGGMMDKEQPADALRREVMEETGLIVEPEEIADAIWQDKPCQLIIVIKARLVGGCFRPSPEVSEHGFFNIHVFPDKLPDWQEKIIIRHGEPATNNN